MTTTSTATSSNNTITSNKTSITITEEELLKNIAEGASQRQQLQETSNTFFKSNFRHKTVDVILAFTTYCFGGFMHVYGQSTPLTSLSMWAAGTTFLLNMQIRRIFDLEDAMKRRQVAEDMNLNEKNVFQLEMIASWVWMLSSMQQFKIHKRMKYCGYSSWMGLGSCMYFTLRHMYSVLLVE